MKEIKQIKRPSKKQVKIFARVSAFIVLMVGFYILTDKAVTFFRENTIVKYQVVKVQFHKPLEIVSLVELNRREQQDKMIEDIANVAIEEYLNPKQNVAGDCEVKSAIDPKVFFDTLRMKESSNGKNTDPSALHNYCANKGMWNEIGYNPQNKFCFKDQEEASLYVAYYVKKNCDGKTQAQCECFWNTGNMTDSCHYSNGELGLAN
jgi:hypothetical protein